jgi:hypothetical protein
MIRSSKLNWKVAAGGALAGVAFAGFASADAFTPERPRVDDIRVGDVDPLASPGSTVVETTIPASVPTPADDRYSQSVEAPRALPSTPATLPVETTLPSVEAPAPTVPAPAPTTPSVSVPASVASVPSVQSVQSIPSVPSVQSVQSVPSVPSVESISVD